MVAGCGHVVTSTFRPSPYWGEGRKVDGTTKNARHVVINRDLSTLASVRRGAKGRSHDENDTTARRHDGVNFVVSSPHFVVTSTFRFTKCERSKSRGYDETWFRRAVVSSTFRIYIKMRKVEKSRLRRNIIKLLVKFYRLSTSF